MNIITQRIQSYLATPSRAQEKIKDLLIELRHRGVDFDINVINEDGKKYFYAESVNYPRGHISATGGDIDELEQELKDAIFTAFEIPVRYCIPEIITFNPPLTKNFTVTANRKVHVAA